MQHCSTKGFHSQRLRINSGMVILRAKPERVWPRFLYQVVRSPEFVAQTKALRSGSAQPQLPIRDIKAVEIPIPPLPTQHRIASILGAYDDLIEVNRRRIAVLEDMARRLFDEWFVHFRFPGHEGHKMVETEQGRVPEEWTATTIGDAFLMTGGGTPSKENPIYWQDGTIPWFTPTDLTGAKTVFMDASKSNITEDGLRRSSAQLFPAGSIMMTSRATIGKIAINTTPASTNQGFITCFPNERVPRFFMYHWLLRQRRCFHRQCQWSNVQGNHEGCIQAAAVCSTSWSIGPTV